MKMAPGIIWGAFLILLGISIILRVAFGIKVFGLMFAFFLIFIGISILAGKNRLFQFRHGPRDVIMEERVITETPRNNSEYNVVFGSSVYDFRNIEYPENKSVRIKLNTVFGRSVVKIRKGQPVHIKSDAVFGSSEMPDSNTVAFGSITYETDSFSVAENHLYIEAPVVFGSLQIKEE
jgi:hypothetical protein